jgi:hypothetical protein
MIPCECLVYRELDYEKCRACHQKKCPFRKGTIEMFQRYKDDQWYAAMREEITDMLEAR